MIKENTEAKLNKPEVPPVSSVFGKEMLVSGEEIITESRPVVWPSSLKPLMLIVAGVVINWLIGLLRPKYMELDFLANIKWIDTAISWIGPAIMIIGALSLLMRWIRRRYTIYALTNKRILRRSGVFSRSYLDCSLGRVQNVEVMMSFISRIFKFGNIRIASARTKGEDIEWLDVKNPIGLQREITESLEKYMRENSRSKD